MNRPIVEASPPICVPWRFVAGTQHHEGKPPASPSLTASLVVYLRVRSRACRERGIVPTDQDQTHLACLQKTAGVKLNTHSQGTCKSDDGKQKLEPDPRAKQANSERGQEDRPNYARIPCDFANSDYPGFHVDAWFWDRCKSYFEGTFSLCRQVTFGACD